MDTVFDPSTQYQLTDEDRQNGWTVKIGQRHLEYKLNGKTHSPSTNQPAIRSWWENGQLQVEAHYQRGDRHASAPEIAFRQWHKGGQLSTEIHYKNGRIYDPATGQPGFRTWWANGAKRSERHYQDGDFASETFWLEDGRRKDLL